MTANGAVIAMFGRSIDGGAPLHELSILGPGDAGWNTLTYAQAYFRHGAVASGTDVYVMGGLAPSGHGLNDVVGFQFLSGQVTEQTFGQVDNGIWGQGMAIGNRVLYAAGGSIGSGPDAGTDIFASTQTLFDPLRPDGSLGGAFTVAAPLKTGRTMSQLVHVRGTLFVIGGFDKDGNPLASIEVSNVQDGGPPSPWADAVQSLPGGRAEHCAVAYGDTIYVLGGATQRDGGVLPDVVMSTVDAQGVLGSWRSTTPLKESLGWLGCTVL